MTKPPRESETPERIYVTRSGDAVSQNKLTDIGLRTSTEYIRADKYAELEKQKSNAFYVLEHAEERIKQLQEQLSAATAALKEARDKARQEALQTLADAVMKFAPDLGNQLAERWKEADGALEWFLTFLRSRP